MKTIAKLSAILLAVTLCAACPAHAQSAAAPTSPSTNAPPRPKATQYRGTITSVDTANMILSLKGRPGNPETKVKVTHDTKIKKDNEPAQFSDAVEGLRVYGSGKKGDDGVWTANTLNITTKPAGPKPTPPASPQ